MSYEHATTEMLIREITGQTIDNIPRLRDIARNPSLLYETGLSKSKARRIEASLELGRRYVAEPDADITRIQGPEDVAAIYGPRLRDLDHERFYVVLLDNSGRVIGESLVSQGTVNASLVHAREVFREAIRNSASAVILVHNHPSGVRVASVEDRAITKCLVDAGRLVEIPVRDHVIIAGSGYVSFSEQGWL